MESHCHFDCISLKPDCTEYYFIYLLLICEVPIGTTCPIFNLDYLVFF